MNAVLERLPLQHEAPPLREDACGVVRVGQTRVTLESVVSLFDQGASAEEIALRYDALGLHEVYATLGYVLSHRQAVTAYLDRARDRAAQARREAEHRPNTVEIRKRLLRRRRAQDDSAAG